MDTSRSQSRLPVADLASFPTRSQEKKLSVAEDPYQNLPLKLNACWSLSQNFKRIPLKYFHLKKRMKKKQPD